MSEQERPFETDRTSRTDTGPRHQPWCQADVPVGADRCPRCQVWQPKNTGALVHGARRLQLLGQGTPLDETRRVALRDAVLTDLGGRAEVSAALAELVEDFAAAVVLRDVAYAHIAAVGPLTRAGRRRAVVDLYLQASQRAERLANQIGTARKPARVPSLQEYLERRAAESDDDPSDEPRDETTGADVAPERDRGAQRRTSDDASEPIP